VTTIPLECAAANAAAVHLHEQRLDHETPLLGGEAGFLKGTFLGRHVTRPFAPGAVW
jgi:hypothetical protein